MARLPVAPRPDGELQPLKRIVLADEVSRTLFREFAEHRAGGRGREEIGWLLMGRRDREEAVALATLPAGKQRDASPVHVRFNAAAQAMASRIVRQEHRGLTLLGVVHTHPGSLRHPSRGDLRGDRVWVQNLRGGEGVFAIGTADAPTKGGEKETAWQPDVHVQCWGRLRLTWYHLRAGWDRYKPLPVGLTLGPDLAADLRPIWDLLESQADRLDRLARQQQRVRFDPVDGPALAVRLPLAGGDELEVRLGAGGAQYYLFRGGQVLRAGLDEPRVDRGVYLMLAELAGG